jgi:hypothetical protein
MKKDKEMTHMIKFLKNQPHALGIFAAVFLLCQSYILKAQDQPIRERTSEVVFKREIPRPEIRFVVPERGGMQVTTTSAQIEAMVYHVKRKNDIFLFCNADTLWNFEFDERTGGLSCTVPVKPGGNYVKIIAVNATGVDSSYTLIVKPEALARRNLPVIQIDSTCKPVPDPMDTARATCMLSGKIHGVFNASDVSMEINGSPVTAFGFDPKTGLFKCEVLLSRGVNKMVWKARNLDGQAEHSTLVEY